ncbi:MAG TPA: heavy metal translocating P-type ATPase [Thermomicrobiales bacterium]|nr:heavy metal translocating P-type ATPase [Thermomicrobiales bacterium]
MKPRHTAGRQLVPRQQPVADSGRVHGFLLIGMTLTCGTALAAAWLLGALDVVGARLEGALFAVAYLAGGAHGTIRACRSLWRRRLDIDLLMVVAAAGAAIIGQWAEGAILLFLFSLGNALQAYAMARTFRAVQALVELSPDDAVVLRDGVEGVVRVEDLRVGDLLVVRPGERIAVDGVVVTGESSVDQSTITGESMPNHKRVGDGVFSGTLNGSGALTVEATRAFSESTLAKIIAIVAEAQGQKSATQRFTDRFEGVYAGGVIAAATLYALLPFALLGRDLADTFYQAMVLLVVASPCALVISTPASILSALANAARRGVLVKGAAQLDALGATRVVAFDKTGTLTVGKPRVTAIHAASGIDEQLLLSLAAAAEARSEHPLARAIALAAAERGVEIPESGDLFAHGGQGVETRVGDDTVYVGSETLMREAGVPLSVDVLDTAARLRANGNTTMFVAVRDSDGARPLGTIGVADTIRPEARDAVRSLRALGVEKIIMLTGDNRQAALSIARQAGIDDVRSELMPRAKLDEIERLKLEYGAIVMVGDGVNDAPALAAATVGVALGAAGTDVALETADIVLMSDDLSMLPYAIALSRKARRIIVQNLSFALTVIAVLAIGTFAGLTPLPIGVIGHEGSTIIVVANGLRLLGGASMSLDAPRPTPSTRHAAPRSATARGD